MDIRRDLLHLVASLVARLDCVFDQETLSRLYGTLRCYRAFRSYVCVLIHKYIYIQKLTHDKRIAAVQVRC